MEKTMKRSEIAAINYRYNVSDLNTMIHNLPHVNWNFEPLMPYFRPHNDEYQAGVTNIGYAPLLVFLILLIIIILMYIAKLFTWEEDLTDRCQCAKMRLTLHFRRGCVALIIVCFLLEIYILLQGLNAHRRQYYPWLSFDNEKYYQAVEEAKANFYFGLAFASAYGDKDKNFTDASLADYKRIFAEFATEVETIWNDIAAPDQPDRVAFSPFMSEYLVFVWNRFSKWLFFWCAGFGLSLCKPHLFWVSAVLGIFWCCMISIALLTDIVTLADICMDPDYTISLFVDQKKTRKHMFYVIAQICEHFKYLSEQSKPKLRECYFKYIMIFATAIAKLKEKTPGLGKLNDANCAKANKACKYLVAAKNHIKTCSETLNTITELDPEVINSCSKLEEIDENIPEDSLVGLCQSDKILLVMLLQFIFVLIVAICYFGILQTHLTTPKLIKKGRRGIISLLKIFKIVKAALLNPKRRYPNLEECLIGVEIVKGKKGKRECKDKGVGSKSISGTDNDEKLQKSRSKFSLRFRSKSSKSSSGTPKSKPRSKMSKSSESSTKTPKSDPKTKRTKKSKSNSGNSKPKSTKSKQSRSSRSKKQLNRTGSRSRSISYESEFLSVTPSRSRKKMSKKGELKKRSVLSNQMFIMDIDSSTKVLVPATLVDVRSEHAKKPLHPGTPKKRKSFKHFYKKHASSVFRR